MQSKPLKDYTIGEIVEECKAARSCKYCRFYGGDYIWETDCILSGTKGEPFNYEIDLEESR